MPKSIIAFYASGAGFSGQRFATEILIQGLKEKGWLVVEAPIPALDRIKEIDNSQLKNLLEFIKLILKLSLVWSKAIPFILKSHNIIYVNLGQTKFALIRDGFPLLIKNFIGHNDAGIVSLHGSLFLNWQKESLEAQLFQRISKVTKYITVLGPIHKDKFISLGIPEQKIVVMDNTCLLSPVSDIEILQKHKTVNFSKEFSQEPITILYLSSLLESKGYVEFIEAINHLSAFTTSYIKVVLCGKITISGEANNLFSNYSSAKKWIENQIKQINQSDRVKLNWINGATGEDKAKLFRQAQIFVLPSRYKVEAQPIAILEALASGCATIATKVGEIPTTLSEKTALLLDDCSSTKIVDAILELSNNSERRKQLALNGLKLYQERFSYDKHIERWEKILASFYS